MRDQDGIKVRVGNKVEVIPSMAVDGHVEGIVWDVEADSAYVSINGQDVMVYRDELWVIPETL